jgi:hypothetical protein
MGAGSGFKTFATGDVLTAADTNGYLMQGVWVFADAAARTAAVTSPQEGNMSFLKDTNSTEYYSGSAWVAVSAAGSPPKLNFVTPSSNFTTTSTSYIDVTGYTITITPVSATNKIQVTANLAVQLGTSSNTEFKLLVDGVNVGGRIEAPLEATEGSITIIGYVSNLAASAKVCKLQMRAAGGVSTTVYGSSSGYISNLGVLEVY